MSELTDIKPCRVCDTIPDKGYPPSRVTKKDWICSKCSNSNRNKWWAKAQVRRKELKNLQGIKDSVSKIDRGLENLSDIPDIPRCPFCIKKMRPNREYKDKEKPLNWHCSSCNEIIVVKGI